MKKLLLLILLLFTLPSFGQSPTALGKDKFFKSLYKDFLKYGTIYGAGDISNLANFLIPNPYL